MKKFFTIFISACLTVAFSISALAEDWQTHWAADYIASARNAGWADMREKNNFEPANNATREEVIYMLYASQLNYPTVLLMEASDDLNGFSDVENINSKYLRAFQVLSANHLISGYADNTLKPKANITRAEMAKLVSYLIPSAILSKEYYGYSDEIPEWAKIDIERCSRAGIISGYSDNTFRPSNYITRAEAVRMIQSLREFISTVEITTQELTTKETTTKEIENITETTTETLVEESTEETTSDLIDDETGEIAKNNMRKANILIEKINEKRFNEGYNELQFEQSLCDIAFLKAKDMYDTNYNQKFSTTFGNLDNRLNEANVKFIETEMLIANGVALPQDVVAIFENDEEMMDILLSPRFSRIGVGVYKDRWAVVFIRVPGEY